MDELFSKGELPEPNFLKIDVEGGEEIVLEGAKQLVQRALSIILVATHGDNEHKFATECFKLFGYEYSMLDHTGSKGDTEILAIPRQQVTLDAVKPANALGLHR
ncbi:MAG: FkbM family methyltransferase [Phycisphaerales bacterium]|nr:MAG: FkbM family methyltransferase [Phycisphaerales bacterium]